MKKIFALLITTMIFMAACQPTPEQETVGNKADGQLQQILESTAAPTGEIKVEERWETTLQQENINININAEINTPGVESYPVLSIAPIIMNQEWADKAIDVFFQGAALYERKMTKQDIEAKMLEIKKVMDQIQSGNYLNGFTDQDYTLLEGEYAVLLDMLETSPDENDLDESDSMLKKINNGQFEMQTLEVMGKKDGSKFSNLYIINNSSVKLNGIEYYNGRVRDFSSTKYDEYTQLKGISISIEEAKGIADVIINEMGIEGVELNSVKVANLYDIRPRFSPEEYISNEQAYQFEYIKTYNGIGVYYFDSQTRIEQAEDGVDLEAYSAVLEPEKLTIIVDDRGVSFLNWKYPTYSDGIISGNVPLLDFEEIKEIFCNQVFYHQFYYGEEGNLDIYIDKITFSYFVQPVKDSNDEYIAIPVWDFINEASGEYNSGRASTYLTINAIDGTVINRDLGY